MMPLAVVEEGKLVTIRRIGGKEEVKHFLESLGFVVGAIISVVSKNNGNLIVNVKGARIAVSKEMANKIMV